MYLPWYLISFDVELGALHRIALGVRRWTTLRVNKNAQPSSYHIVLSVVSRVPLSRVSCLSVVVSIGVLPRLPDSDKPCFFVIPSKSVDTR